jgi:hypothetical protein
MEAAILGGREFETRERSTEVCVLNQAAAAFLFPGQAAVDREVASLNEPPPRTIHFPVTADVADGNLVFLLNGPTKAGVIARLQRCVAGNRPDHSARALRDPSRADGRRAGKPAARSPS